jgi:anti-anti-sigma factor
MAPGFRATERDGVAFLVGELDTDTATTTASAAVNAAVDHANGRIVVDLSALTFCDSSGLSVLLGAVIRAGGRPVVLRNPHGGVRRVLDLSGVISKFVVDYDPPA